MAPAGSRFPRVQVLRERHSIIGVNNHSTPSLAGRLRSKLAEELPPRRLYHVLGVEGLAVHLAGQWGASAEKAMLAALLHDAAKTLPDSEQKALMMDSPVFTAGEEDLAHAQLWHGPAATSLAVQEYGIQDREVLEAVAYHTTGNPGVGTLGLVLYVADYLEPTRSFADVSELRREVLPLPPRRAALAVARRKLRHIANRGRKAHGRTIAMEQWLRDTLSAD